MRKNAVVFSLALIFLFVLAGILIFLHDFKGSWSKASFDQIEIGMTRQQVDRLIEKNPHAAHVEWDCLDSWDFEDGSFMWVVFEPDRYVEPNTLDQRDPKSENWKVVKVILMGNQTTIRGLLKRFGMWSGSCELAKP